MQPQHEMEAATASASGEIPSSAGSEIPPNAFPKLLMRLLNDEAAPDALWWLPNGKAFAIDPKEVPSKVLDKHFRGTKFSSFIRRLHNTGFRRTTRLHRKDPELKLPEGAITLSHDLFQRGKPELLENFSKQVSTNKATQFQEAKLGDSSGRASVRRSSESKEADLSRTSLLSHSSDVAAALTSRSLLQQAQPSLQQRLLESSGPPSSLFALRERDRLAFESASAQPSQLLGFREASSRALPGQQLDYATAGLTSGLFHNPRQLHQDSSMIQQQLLLQSLSSGEPQQQHQQGLQQQMLQQQQLQRIRLELAAAAEQDRARQMEDLFLLARARNRGRGNQQDPSGGAGRGSLP